MRVTIPTEIDRSMRLLVKEAARVRQLATDLEISVEQIFRVVREALVGPTLREDLERIYDPE